MIEQLKRRIMLMIGRAVLITVNDTNSRQFVQLEALDGEIKNDVERVQDFGFTSNPPIGSQAVLINLFGNRDHPIVIATDDPKTRKTGLKSGEASIYDAFGNFIHLQDDGTILIKASDKVRIEADRLEVTGDIIDRCDVNNQSMYSMRNVYNGHTHTGDDGGNTSDPHQEM